MMMEYWEECISEAFEDAGITASKAQIETVASWAEGSHDNYSMAHGHDCIPHPENSEVAELKLEIKRLNNEHDISDNVAEKRLHSICLAHKIRINTLRDELEEANKN
jgi:hypothetical protein